MSPTWTITRLPSQTHAALQWIVRNSSIAGTAGQ